LIAIDYRWWECMAKSQKHRVEQTNPAAKQSTPQAWATIGYRSDAVIYILSFVVVVPFALDNYAKGGNAFNASPVYNVAFPKNATTANYNGRNATDYGIAVETERKTAKRRGGNGITPRNRCGG
jgi:hypothetical protein